MVEEEEDSRIDKFFDAWYVQAVGYSGFSYLCYWGIDRAQNDFEFWLSVGGCICFFGMAVHAFSPRLLIWLIYAITALVFLLILLFISEKVGAIPVSIIIGALIIAAAIRSRK